MRDLNNIETLMHIVGNFLGDERDETAKSHALAKARAELSKRPAIDEDKLKYCLEAKKLTIDRKYPFFEKCIIPDIRNGKYDGIAEQAKQKPPLLSTNLFKAMDEIGVKDDIDRTLIDYYLGVVWEQSDITIDEIRYFTESAIGWMGSLPEEKRKASVLLELCKRSSTLSKHLPRDKAMETVREWVEEGKRMDDEFEAICGGKKR